MVNELQVDNRLTTRLMSCCSKLTTKYYIYVLNKLNLIEKDQNDFIYVFHVFIVNSEHI